MGFVLHFLEAPIGSVLYVAGSWLSREDELSAINWVTI
jgi:hypothetical protein